MHVQEMYRRLTGLVVFRRLLQDPVVAACGEMLSARVRGDSGDFSAACAGFEAALFQLSLIHIFFPLFIHLCSSECTVFKI